MDIWLLCEQMSPCSRPIMLDSERPAFQLFANVSTGMQRQRSDPFSFWGGLSHEVHGGAYHQHMRNCMQLYTCVILV